MSGKLVIYNNNKNYKRSVARYRGPPKCLHFCERGCGAEVKQPPNTT